MFEITFCRHDAAFAGAFISIISRLRHAIRRFSRYAAFDDAAMLYAL